MNHNVPSSSNIPESSYKKSVKKHSASFYLLVFGTLLNLSAYVGILNLQSSLNISHSLGTISLSVLYGTSIVICLFFTHFGLNRFGPKVCLIIGEASFTAFTIANFYPKTYTLIIASIIASLGEAFIWSACALYITRLVSKVWASRKPDEYGEEFTEHRLRHSHFGLFYALLKLCQVSGNVISYGVLYGGRMLHTNIIEKNITNISNCGVMQTHDDSQHHEFKYKPSSITAVYALIGIYVAMQFTSVIIHILFLDSYPGAVVQDERKDLLRVIGDSVNETFNHAKSLYQLLLTPITISYGLLLAFSFSDFTRGFVACSLGVEKIGLLMTVYGGANGITAFFVGKLSSHVGLLYGFIFSTIIGLGTWLGVYLWIPTSENVGWLFVLAFMLGTCDGVWQTVITASLPVFFVDSEEAAFSVQALYVVVGMTIGFSWSSFLLIRTKIIVSMTAMLIGSALYFVAEYIRWNRNKTGQSDNERRSILRPE